MVASLATVWRVAMIALVLAGAGGCACLRKPSADEARVAVLCTDIHDVVGKTVSYSGHVATGPLLGVGGSVSVTQTYNTSLTGAQSLLLVSEDEACRKYAAGGMSAATYMNFLTDVIAAGRSLGSPGSGSPGSGSPGSGSPGSGSPGSGPPGSGPPGSGVDASADIQVAMARITHDLEIYAGSRLSFDTSVLAGEVLVKIAGYAGQSSWDIVPAFQAKADALLGEDSRQGLALWRADQGLAALNDRLGALDQRLVAMNGRLDHLSSVMGLPGPPDTDSDDIIPHDDRSELLVRFATGAAVLSAASEARLKAYLAAPGLARRSVRLLGYADDRGTAGFNLFLSQARTEYVSDLLSKAGYRVVTRRGHGVTARFGPDVDLNRMVMVQTAGN